MLAQYISRNFRPCLRNIRIYTYNQIPSISTSKKKKDTLVYPDDLFPKKMPAPPKTVEDFAETKNPKVNEVLIINLVFPFIKISFYRL